MKKTLVAACAAVVLGFCVLPAQAQVVITPVDVAASSAWPAPERQPGNLIDGVGMTWVSPLENSIHDSESNNTWHANEPAADVWVAFDLGSELDLQSMVVWNIHPTLQYLEAERMRGIQEYDLILADSTLDLADVPGTLAGATVATFPGLILQMAANEQFAPGEVVDFADTSGVQHVVIDVISNYDGSPYTGLSEVRFTAVPEPTSFILLCLGLMGMVAVTRRKK